jgi:Ala-tRNA(Pro) deacylase
MGSKKDGIGNGCHDIIGVHPNDNTATIWLKSKDLISIIKEYGSSVHVVRI